MHDGTGTDDAPLSDIHPVKEHGSHANQAAAPDTHRSLGVAFLRACFLLRRGRAWVAALDLENSATDFAPATQHHLIADLYRALRMDDRRRPDIAVIPDGNGADLGLNHDAAAQYSAAAD